MKKYKFSIIDHYPSLKNAYLEMEYDNGGINRFRTEEQACKDADVVLRAEGVVHEDLVRLNQWLSTKTAEEIHTIVAGEDAEAMAICEWAPKGGPDDQPLTNIFNDLFENSATNV